MKEIVIKIPDEEYEDIIYSEDCGLHRLTRAIARGIVLPKGHGRLIDENDLIGDSEYEDGVFHAVSVNQINNTLTIIEADTESEDE